MSPVLNLSPNEILKNNEGMLEKDLRKSIAAPSTPSDLVSSSEKAATDVEIVRTEDDVHNVQNKKCFRRIESED